MAAGAYRRPARQAGGRYEVQTDHAMPGASGNQIFRFLVDASGTGTIEMRYLRPWEKDTPPAKVLQGFY